MGSSAAPACAAESPGWPAGLALDDPDEAPSVYDAYPRLFASGFPAAPPSDVERLVHAARRYASAVFAVDDLVDGDHPERATTAPLRILALLHEAYVDLGALFPAQSPFWPALMSCLSRYTAAMADEARFRAGPGYDSATGAMAAYPGPQGAAGLTEHVEQIAVDKSAVAEVTAHALGSLGGDDAAGARLARSIRRYNLACALEDDLLDWRADLAAGRPNLFLAYAVSAPHADGRAGPAQLAEAGYRDGAGQAMLARAIRELDAAASLVADLDLPVWRAALERTRTRIENLRTELDTWLAVGNGTTGGGRSITVALGPAPEPGTWSWIARSGATYLAREAETGWRAGSHLMRFPREEGFTVPDGEVAVGDVFTTALVGSALAEWDAAMPGRPLAPVLDVLARRLSRRRRASERGGWSYFPDLPELPADADDLAEVVRVLSRLPGAGELRGILRDALDFALSLQEPSGRMPTWLVDDAGPHCARQRRFVETQWGDTADVEVVANLAHAAYRFDPGRYAAAAAAACRYVAAAQTGDGRWPSTWYHGETWGWWVCGRLLALDDRYAAAGRRAADRIAAAQNPDGGWGAHPGSPSTPAHTALALLAHTAVLGGHGARADAARARRFLAGRRLAGGGWPAEPLIAMDLARASRPGARAATAQRTERASGPPPEDAGAAAGGPSSIVSHGSAPLTTALVTLAGTALGRTP